MNNLNERTANDFHRVMRRRQAKRNETERRNLLDAIEDRIPYVPRLIDFKNELTLRTECDDEKIFRAVKLRRSEHFPGIVPELVNNDGDYLLITWLTFGSLLRLMNEVR